MLIRRFSSILKQFACAQESFFCEFFNGASSAEVINSVVIKIDIAGKG